ncbi:Gfo/Idh/MocA family oxidoreductase [Cohnella soli]|uniref:Gfo/Idh/MocA family oxidoreductase n=1 Tax=Cohnella soli TaxID=425005 RepID=A0ABW0HYR6_9BACL
MAHQPLRLAIVGGNRGGRFKKTISALAGQIELAAICDVQEEVLLRWKADYPDIATYGDYRFMLQNPRIDAVLIASPMLLHARQAIDALKAGKHVLSEVIAAHTLDGAWELVETVEKTGLVYMMAENYCFSRSNLAVRHMAEQGLFGEITYLEGGYIHELRHLAHQRDGSLTWRGQLHHDYNGMNYPTHAIGPITQWIALNRGKGDRLETLSTFVSNARSMRRYFQEHFGNDHPASQEGYWRQGDCAVTNLLTRDGVLITLRVDWTSVRPHNMRHYALQGTEGAFVSKRHDREDDLVWIHGRSPHNQRENGEREELWEPLSRYLPEFDHPDWRRWEAHALGASHGGGDFLVLQEFVSAIRDKRSPLIDVYDAAAWSSIFPLSMESHALGGNPVQVPDFGKRRRLS